MKYIDITPEDYQMCNSCGCGCPAVLETENSYVIIGKKLSADAYKAVEGRVAEDEFAIEVEKGMIDGLKLQTKAAA